MVGIGDRERFMQRIFQKIKNTATRVSVYIPEEAASRCYSEGSVHVERPRKP
jgi:hypothetical protein